MTPQVFLALGIVGFVVLAISAFLGDDIETDFGGDVEPGAELETDAEGSILDWFSVKGMAAGLVAFGFVGWALAVLGVDGVLLWIFSVLSGLILWSIVVVKLLPWLKDQQGHDMRSINALVGLQGTVVVRIQADSIGTVQVADRTGTITRVNAGTMKGKEIPEGAEVLIISTDSSRVYVDTFSI